MMPSSVLRGIATAILTTSFLLAVGCDSDKSSRDEKSSDDDDGPRKKKDKKKKKDKDDGTTKVADETQERPKAPQAPTAPAPAKTAEVAPTIKDDAPPAAPVTSPTQQTYPDIANKISESCASPWVILATAPNSVGVDYPWTWSRQALLANQQFKVVSGEPSAPGEVTFQVHLASDRFQSAWVLVGKCQDGGTCNKLAAMYKAIVKGAQSQPACGKLPMDLSPATFKKPVLRELGDPQRSLPESKDTIGKCARLQACSVAMDPPNKAGKEEIGYECQKSPSKFNTSCATRYPCAEVMKCLDGG